MQIMANHDVVVNHNNRCVTILANFVSPAPIENAMIQAANFWNLSSAKKKHVRFHLMAKQKITLFISD